MPPESNPADGETIDQGLVRALAHPMRVQILEALQGRTASPTELAREFHESLGVVSYHANALLDVACNPSAARSSTSTPPVRARSSAIRTGAGRRARCAAA